MRSRAVGWLFMLVGRSSWCGGGHTMKGNEGTFFFFFFFFFFFLNWCFVGVRGFFFFFFLRVGWWDAAIAKAKTM
jgi:hypothetical protein